MSLTLCRRASSSRLVIRTFSAQAIIDTIGGYLNHDRLPPPSIDSKSTSFRKKIEASTKEFVNNERQVIPPKPGTLSHWEKISVCLSKAQTFSSNLHLARPKKRQTNIKKISFALTNALHIIGKHQFLLERRTLSSLSEEAKKERISRKENSYITAKLQKVSRQLRLAQERARGSSRGSQELVLLEAIKAEIAFLQAKRAAIRYSLKRSREIKSKELNIDHTNKVDGMLMELKEPVLEEVPPLEASRPIARLAHGLDRVLFNPNVYWFQDPHSKVYNFPQALQKIPAVTDFAFDRVTGFVTSSRDTELFDLAKLHGKRFIGSTSSLSGLLSHIYYLVSAHRPPDVSIMTPKLQKLPKGFSPGTKIPTAVTFRRSKSDESIYALDSVSDEEEGKNILSFLGTMLERYLTLSPESFAKFLKGSDPPIDITCEKEAYRYSKSSKFIMRSQLDCHDRRLPGTGVFDLKTRACIAIRRDRLNWEENAGYQIVKQHGMFESFEREYFDLIRSAFLKFQFQVRIGNMDGIFVAYHNTEKFFGFQYISLEEMDIRLFGSSMAGKRVFEKCVGLLEALADEIVDSFPGESISCVAESLEGRHEMDIYLYPARPGSALISDDAPRPKVKLLQLRVKHSRNGQVISGDEAIWDTARPWTLEYSIYHVKKSQEEIWKMYDESVERKNMSMYLPNGVTVEEFLKTWHSLNYGASGSTESTDESSTPPLTTTRKFIPPANTIQHLRRLAQKGRRATESQAKDDMIKVAWRESVEGLETADNFGHFIFQDSETDAFPGNMKEVFVNDAERQQQQPQQPS